MTRDPKHENVLASIKKEVPQSPGVYIFRDKRGKVIYIGKSVNIRKRMSAYLQKGTMTPDDPYPTFKMVGFNNNYESSLLFGPFRDQYFIANVMELIYKLFKIRTCTDSKPKRKCINNEIGKCLGPCRKEVTIEEYSNTVNGAVDFLNGNKEYVINELQLELDDAVQNQDFEKADKLREQLKFCETFCERQQFVQKFKNSLLILYKNNEKKLVHVFNRGIGITRIGDYSLESILQIVKQVDVKKPQSNRDDRFVLDKANIVHRWIRDKSHFCRFQFIHQES